MGIRKIIIIGLWLSNPMWALTYLPDFLSISGGYSACMIFSTADDPRHWILGISAIRFFKLKELQYQSLDGSRAGWSISYSWISLPFYRLRSGSMAYGREWKNHWSLRLAYQGFQEKIGGWYHKDWHLPTIGLRYRIRSMTVAVIGNQQWISLGGETGHPVFRLGLNFFRLTESAQSDFSFYLKAELAPSIQCLFQYDWIRESFSFAVYSRLVGWNWWIGIRLHPQLPETMMLRSSVVL